MLTHVVTVIAREDDDCVLRQTEPIERGDDSPHLGIEKADTRIVGLGALAVEFVGELILLLLVAAEGSGRHIFRIVRYLLVGPHRLGRVVVEIRLLRCHVGRVGPVKSHCQKEGTILLFCAAFQDPFRVLRQHRIGVKLVALRRSIPAQRATVLAGSQRDDRPLVDAIDPGGIEFQLPRTRIVMTICPDRVGNVVMIELSDPPGQVSLEPEGLRQADGRGNRLAEDERVAEDPGAVRIEPRQDRVPARTAEWKGTVGLVEAHPAGGEGVDVRRLRLFITIAAKVIVEVVGDEEEDIRAVRGGGDPGEEDYSESVEGSVHGERGLGRFRG